MKIVNYEFLSEEIDTDEVYNTIAFTMKNSFKINVKDFITILKELKLLSEAETTVEIVGIKSDGYNVLIRDEKGNAKEIIIFCGNMCDPFPDVRVKDENGKYVLYSVMHKDNQVIIEKVNM